MQLFVIFPFLTLARRCHSMTSTFCFSRAIILVHHRVSGIDCPSGALDQACKTPSQQGLMFARLRLPSAFHATQVVPIMDRLEEAALHMEIASRRSGL